MEEGPQVYYIGIVYGGFFSGAAAAGGSGGDDPNRPRDVRSAHEVDAAPPAPPRRRRPAGDAGEGPCQCPVCGHRFISEKAVHGHMRSHPERPWRGMKEPRQPEPEEKDGKPYACDRCGERFETRQALGGHRASHNGRKGCFWLSRNAAAAAEQPPKTPLPFDLNEPPAEDDDDEE
ncbi:hypothetical protein ACP70R_043704 [Stipagrostis hirtigluma subsp. patula]